MPRANLLSENEKGQIIAYYETGMLNRAIARKISRSPRVVNNFLKNSDAYGTKNVAVLNLSLNQEISEEFWWLRQIQAFLVAQSRRN